MIDVKTNPVLGLEITDESVQDEWLVHLALRSGPAAL